MRYRGPDWDDTYEERGSIDYPVLHPVPRLQTRRLPSNWNRSGLIMSRWWMANSVCQGFSVRLRPRKSCLLHRTIDLARRHGIEVQFLYLPGYRAPTSPRFAEFYTQFGPLWYPEAIYGNTSNWLDVNHLNYYGASALSHWLGNSIAGLMEKDTALVSARHQ